VPPLVRFMKMTLALLAVRAVVTVQESPNQSSHGLRHGGLRPVLVGAKAILRDSVSGFVTWRTARCTVLEVDRCHDDRSTMRIS
jgi:hypothetical protein